MLSTRAVGKRLFLSRALALLAVVWASSARAQSTTTRGPSPSEQLLAESLFEQARTLMDQGKFAEACPKFAESQRLDPSGGTFLNLAVCHEREGRLGTAYVELTAAATQAARDGRKDREQVARDHLTAIAPRLPRLTVVVAQDESELEVMVDGTLLRRPAWGVAAVVDPGPHIVEATAPGKVSFSTQITITEGEKRTVDVPPLRAGAGAPPAETGSKPYEHAPEPPSHAGRTLAGIATGVGFTVAGVAAALWVPYTIQRRTQCVDDREYCSSKGLDYLDVERITFWVAVGGAAVGTAGLVTFLVLPSNTKVSATPTTGGAAVFLNKTF